MNEKADLEHHLTTALATIAAKDEELAKLTQEQVEAGHLFGKIGLLAREYVSMSDNAPTAECIEGIQLALAALKLRSERIDRAVTSSIVTLLERFQAGEANLLFTAQAITLKEDEELARVRKELEAVRLCFADASHSSSATIVHVEMLQKELTASRQSEARLREALDWFRNMLKNGLSIQATDVNSPILVLNPDGSIWGGLTITAPGFSATLNNLNAKNNDALTPTNTDSKGGSEA